MSTRKALLMLIILALGFAYLRIFQKERAPELKREIPIFADFPIEKISSVRSVAARESSVVLKNPDGLWEMEKPFPSRVSQERISEFLEHLATLSAVDKIPPEQRSANSSVYGLSTPELFLTLKTEMESETLSFGSTRSLTGRVYAQLQSSAEILLLEAGDLEFVKVGIKTLRERHPFIFDPADVSAVVLVPSDSDPVRFLRKENWVALRGEEELSFDVSKFISALSSLHQAEAGELVDGVGPQLALYGLDHRALVIQIELRKPNIWGEKSITARIGEGVSLELTEQGGGAKVQEAFYVKTLSGSVVYKFLDDRFSVWRNAEQAFRNEVESED